MVRQLSAACSAWRRRACMQRCARQAAQRVQVAPNASDVVGRALSTAPTSRVESGFECEDTRGSDDSQGHRHTWRSWRERVGLADAIMASIASGASSAISQSPLVLCEGWAAESPAAVTPGFVLQPSAGPLRALEPTRLAFLERARVGVHCCTHARAVPTARSSSAQLDVGAC